jgi:hypothetical protein
LVAVAAGTPGEETDALGAAVVAPAERATATVAAPDAATLATVSTVVARRKVRDPVRRRAIAPDRASS